MNYLCNMGHNYKMKTIKKELGFRIKQIRTMQGLNQRKFGELLGVGISAISAYEAGKSVPPPETLMKIADYGNVTVDYLFSGSEVGRSALLSKIAGIPVLSDGTHANSSSREKTPLISARHGEAVLELTKEEFTLISLFKKLPPEAQKEKLLELAYLTAVRLNERH